ncbi:hypothetical protein G9A89_020598 [Geosiphon pyriformis]|nr:hypothetical protein G9A89_020598 [Geosiphon pyriformis]
MSKHAILRHLLEKSQNIANSVSAKKDLPPIERNLEEIETQSRKFASKINKPGESPEKKAPFFLANIGIDGDKLSQTVRSINVLGTFEPRELISEADTTNYVEYKYRSTVTSIIQDGHNQTIQDYHDEFERSLNLDWERSKIKVFEELGQHQPFTHGSINDQDSSFTPYRGETPKTGGPSLRAAPTSWPNGKALMIPRSEAIGTLNSRMGHYSEAVVKLNASRVRGVDFAVLNSFENAARKISSERGNKLIIECWRALARIVGEENVLEGQFQRNHLKERQFANPYQSRIQPGYNELEKRLLAGSRQYLEEQYKQFLEDYIAGHRKEAHMGGVPSPRNKAEAFMRANHRPNGGKTLDHLETNAEKIPIWGVIFTLIRVGLLNEALEVARDNERLFHRNDKPFLTYFTDYVQKNRRLSRDTREQLVAEIKQRIKLSAKHPQDYYKLTVYHILAQLSLTTFPNTAIPSTEDYLWFNLMIIQYDNSESDSINETVFARDFQKYIVQFGPNSYTSDGKDPVQYFKVLLISAQFERAVDYLVKTDFSVEAVHFGIALAYYGLLRAPDSQETMAMLVESSDGISAYLNFNALIYNYAQRFYTLNPRLVVHYFSFMHLYGDDQTEAGRHQIELSHAYIRQLVFDTCSFEELLGDPRKNIAGEIVANLKILRIDSDTEYKAKIIAPLGRQFEENGKYRHALQLFELAKDYDALISVLNKMLGEYIWMHSHHQASPDADSELDPAFVKRKFQQYETDHLLYHSGTALVRDCELLMDLTDFVRYFNQKDYVKALEFIEELNIFPLDDDLAGMAKRNQELYTASKELRRNIPDLMVLTMESMYEYHKQLKMKASPGGLLFDNDNYSKMQNIQRKARSLMTFVGLIKQSLPTDTYNSLARLEVLMR